MNKSLGLVSSIIVTICTTIFLITLITGSIYLSYFVCLVLSWGFVLLICSFASSVEVEKKALSFGAISFAVIYSCFVSVVYFSQLTIVRYGNLSDQLLRVFDFQYPGSLMFVFDLFGYGMMAISTFLIAFVINPKFKALRILLFIHGLFALSCILMPILNVFNNSMGSDFDLMGTIALIFWCIYFIPIGVLSYRYFLKQ